MKMLWAILIGISFLYAPIEWTRVIINWGVSGRFLFEVVFIWVAYLIGMFLVYKRIK